ncbi:mycothione reductase [Pseudonocardia abyssalis]|uniref:Mycothione reductase n=1 Tax=Pseudonocardia abyssalis TaxID=2792008 RepID=A0ABS6URE3_9PSEU|nr:mycothione reductase [Pseudonocardia abyssalis]MBW0113755.1 mycothione reductase [Pseudonocardia abyssalis]MBW0134828.1 mycothione reductase [Pseudonocardia abyssalis]
MRHHDLAVIGAGSGSSMIDSRFDGLDVAVVERARFGGTCLNAGCIPTKMYVYAAHVADMVRRAHRLGIDATVDKVRWNDIRERVFNRIDPISESVREYRMDPVRTPNVTAYLGHARFTGPKAMQVERSDGSGRDDFTADRIVIAAGARPEIPTVVAESGVPHHTAESIMRLSALPERLVILGGGYIGAEFAHVFSALGSAVSVVTRGPLLLRQQDESVATAFTALAQRSWDVHLGHEVLAVRGDESEVHLDLTDGTTVSGDALLIATGRRPNSDEMDLDRAGIHVHADGRIAVDAQQRTSVDGVYALGDVSSPYQLKHVANHEKRVVAHNLLHPDDPRAVDHRFVPSAVFTEPPIAAVGLTEQQCREQGLDVTVGVQMFGDVAYGWAMEDTTGFCKIIADRSTGRLLGAHVMGPEAPSIIQPLIQAMSFGQDARTVATGQYWIHPALPEVIENALLDLRFP